MNWDTFVFFLPLLTVGIGLVGALVQWIGASRNPRENIAHEPPAAIFWRTIIYSVVVATLLVAINLLIKLDRVEIKIRESSVALSSVELLGTFNELLKANERASATSGFLRNLLLERLRTFQVVVQDAQRGRIYVGADEMGSVALSLIEASSASIRATSYVTPDAWWGTAWGRRYMADNEAAVRRNVRVERTFIFKDQEEFQKWEHVLSANHQAGIVVRYDFADRLPHPFTQDVINIDNKFVGVLELDGRSIKRVYFSSDPNDLRMVNDTLRIAEFAVKYPPASTDGESK